jgi:hypothetical protein
MTAQETTIDTPPKAKGKNKQIIKSDEPPSYESLLKQINACSMEERQKLLESFSTNGSDDEGF